MLQSQLVSWEKTKKTTAAKSRQRVLEQIQLSGIHGMTLFELVKILGIPVNSISGRVTELKKMKLIYTRPSDFRINPETGKAGMIWKSRDL